MIVTGTTVDESEKALALAESHPGVLFATAGVHPHHARDCGPDTITKLKDLLSDRRVVALGECGLDFNRNYSPHPDQEKCFIAQLELASHFKKPLFLHSRDAHPRFAEILKHHQVKNAVAHCFTGERDELRACLDLGLCIGITGWICDERRRAPARAGPRGPPRPAASRDRLAVPRAARSQAPAQRSAQRACFFAAHRADCCPRGRPPRGRSGRRDLAQCAYAFRDR